MPPLMQSVYSSHVDAVGHDPETKELHVRWDTGRTSVYEGVSADVADAARNAWSVGGFIRDQVKGRYPHRYG